MSMPTVSMHTESHTCTSRPILHFNDAAPHQKIDKIAHVPSEARKFISSNIFPDLPGQANAALKEDSMVLVFRGTNVGYPGESGYRLKSAKHIDL